MKVLLIDKGGYFLDFALRCIAAGHEVRWWLGKFRNGDRNPQGDGMGIIKVVDWRPSMRWADIILLPDNSDLMEDLRQYRRNGFPIFGPNEELAEWELNRGRGMAVLEQVGIDTIPSMTFKRISEAKAFLAQNPRRFVSKLNDDNDTKAMSYVSKSAKDMLFMLEKWEKLGAMGCEFVFQEFIPGTEVAIGGWFGPGGFSRWWLENFEHKKLMAGNIGVNTGEMGTVMRYTDNSPLADHFLKPLEGHLYRANYTGYIDIALMVGKDGRAWPLEFTTRPGWPLFEIQQALHPDPVEWMGDLIQGRDTFSPSTQIAVGVCITMPDFPFCTTPKKEKFGYPLYGAETIPAKNFHPSQVMMGEAPGDSLRREPTLVTAGECVCTISGIGSTVSNAMKAAYRNVKRLELPNSPMYRIDIGAKVDEDAAEIARHDWVIDWPEGGD